MFFSFFISCKYIRFSMISPFSSNVAVQERLETGFLSIDPCFLKQFRSIWTWTLFKLFFGYSLQIQCSHSFLIKSFLITPLFSLETTMVSVKKVTEKKNSNDYLICLSSMLCYFFKTLKCNLFPEKKWMI